MKLAIDIGATKIAFGMFDGSVEPAYCRQAATPTDDWADFQRVVLENACACSQATGAIQEIGVSVGGMIDPSDQMVSCANIPSISGRELGRNLSSLLGRPVFIRNDAECLALAESTFGVGKEFRQVFAVILGSGIGGAISDNRRLLSGATGRMGEWGHGNCLDHQVAAHSLKSRTCGCGHRNCLDLFGAGLGMSNIHADLCGARRSAHEILSAWHEKSEDAAKTVAVFLQLVSEQLAFAINVIDPDIVPVAGGLASDKRLIEKLDSMVRERAIGKNAQPLVVQATHRKHGCLLGASLLTGVVDQQ